MGFIEAHPAIDLRLHHAYTPPDYRREQVDLGVNWGTGDWPGVTAEKVLDGGLTPVCAPRLAARLRDENRTDAVLSLPLFYEFCEDDWRAWLRGCGGEGARVDGASMTRIDDSHALRRVALEGHGLALFFRELAAEDLAIGRLVQPFDHVVDTGSHYFLTCPEGRELSAAAKAFRRWLFAERRADG